MNIWLPIITNAVIAILLLVGLFVGRKNGFGVQLAKFLTLASLVVGSYFLVPVLATELVKIEFIQQLVALNYGAELLNSAILFVLFIVSYILVSIVVALVRHGKSLKDREPINGAKSIKAKIVDKKVAKQLKREEKLLAKMNKKKPTVASRVFGAILGILIGLVAGFALMMPFKYVSKGVAETKPELEQITTGYEYTIYGQLDNLTGIVDKINER